MYKKPFNGSVRAKRISNRELARRAETAIREGQKSFLILLACLAQKGGEIEVTSGTLDQVGTRIASLDYTILQHPTDARTKIVKLIGEGK